ncbi:ROK family protein [Salinarimonas soli]|uniref:ROK family protein n=1 Tax=Salinarimonas soli TaxID=1638099 RepID=A0A5B2VFX9_9HYPH|nr:ROK family protein [Salinarimonas soli]KAA2237037.1 ROK family protein [Salinarimonas soli]
MSTPSPLAHGSPQLPSVVLDNYNIELRDEEGGFLGDRASNRAFRAILEDWRERLRETNADGDDPLGDQPSRDIGKKRLDKALIEGDPEAAGLVMGAIEEFAQEMASVTRRFLRAKGWKDTQRVVVGGGLRDSRLGELAIGRASVILKAAGGIEITLVPIRHHPDEAGLLGAAHLMPSWMFTGHDSLLAVDIGGSNIRAGIVALNLKKAADLSRASVWKSMLWRHRDDDKPTPSRDDAVARLAGMIEELIGKADREGLKLAPFIGVGCPGLIREDGTIERGGQNLPGGNWESSRFNLAKSLREAIPKIGGHETVVLIHNDAVVQGLSEVPFMKDVERWGVLTIGTGLGNARFTNRAAPEDAKR